MNIAELFVVIDFTATQACDFETRLWVQSGLSGQ